MLIGILNGDELNQTQHWENACKRCDINYTSINLLAYDWYEKILKKEYDLFLLKPPGNIERHKQVYDERILFLVYQLNKKIFPSYYENLIYENKRVLSNYLKVNNIPHPNSFVFYSSIDAIKFVENTNFPLVAKTSIGASGSGVDFIKNKKNGIKYIKRAFSNKGVRRKFGPNKAIGNPTKWIKKTISSPKYFVKKVQNYYSIFKETQNGYVIFQEYIPHNFEWRAVRIGESYFAHKKIKYKDKASGSKGIDYVNPPLPLLQFTKSICEKNNLQCVAIDIFEDERRGYLVNEIQTIFGHVQSHILEVDRKPGRYIYSNENWVFEEGLFNSNESYDLRLKTAIDLFYKSEL